MELNIAALVKLRILNKWGLFWLLSLSVSFFIILAVLQSDLSSPQDITHLISYSVRWAVPFVYLVASISSMKILFPGVFSAWWMRNRKYIGFVFAVAMTWQAVFIYILSNFYREFYFEEVYYFRDELEGSVGYIFLVFMVITSFRFARSRLNKMQWDIIHKGGVYFLWAYAFSVYWWNIFYYPYYETYAVPELHDYFFYWTGFIVFALRIAAWGKSRNGALFLPSKIRTTDLGFKFFGLLLIVGALAASGTGNLWYKPLSSFLLAPKWSEELSLWLPFWPLEPFLSLMVLGIGTLFLTLKGTAPDDKKEIASSSRGL